MFGEVSKPLSAEMSEIFKSRPKFRLGYLPYFTPTYQKISISQFLLIINYPVSYHVDKAYKVIFGLIFEVLGQILAFDGMRKTDV